MMTYNLLFLPPVYDSETFIFLCCDGLFFLSAFKDYLVDDGTEGNSTSDLLLERNREQSLVDLLVPTMVLLVSLLHKLQVS